MNKMNHRALRNVRRACLNASALTGFMLLAQPASAVVINDNYTPAQVVDTTNITGIGQMVVDEQNGFIGLCTVTLINPRTVIFASHCVNENPAESAFMPATGYGNNNGGLPIGFFFNANNNAAGNSAIGQWLNGVNGGPKDQSNPANGAYNSNFVVYNTNCCTIGLGNNFLQSDIAIAALDTPAVGVPTHTLLFSPLTQPEHATIEGYGDNGTGTTGQGTIDFKRRVAENIVSVLGSLDDQDSFLFGAPDGLPANLYMIDFNDPAFGTPSANPFDFNVFHDTATTKEGITAPGDSGGPLLIDHAFTDTSGNPVTTVAGVLSGGDRFFNAQPGASYGTTSFYQPLYLYWDWIISNNPYKYVGNVAGNGSWTDPNHWQMLLDPDYVTLNANGQLVNALPTTPAQGEADIAPGFGEVCYFDACVNIVTGVVTNPTPAPGANPSSGTQPFGGILGVAGFEALVEQYIAAQNGQASDSGLSDDPAVESDAVFGGGAGGSILSAQAGGGGGGTPSAQSNWDNPEGSALVGGEMVQGAPGASPGQAPNDQNANVATDAPARYYDVTLAAAGTTTLSGASITIDRLTINGSGTTLDIAADGHLTSLIDTTVDAGTMQVDGTYTSAGAFTLAGGTLTGTGTVTAPTLTSLVGIIAPGTIGTVGTLTLDTNLTLSAVSTLLVDLTPTTSDLLDVNGTAAVNGFLAANLGSGSYALGDTWTVVTSTGALSGQFSDGIFQNLPVGMSAALTYDANDAYLTLVAVPFTWGLTPAGSDWNTAANWMYGIVPSASNVANFMGSTKTNITIGAPAAAQSLLFDPGAPAYSFTITGTSSATASLTLGNGITNDSSNAPSFMVSGASLTHMGVLAFSGSGNAANATITAGSFGGVAFAGTADAGSAATLIAQSGGLFDFTQTTGAADDGKINAGSIAGAGVFNIGSNTLTVGALNTSTEVSGMIAGTGGLVKTGTGTLTLSGANTYTGATTINAGTLQLGDGGAGGMVAGNIADNTALVFDRSDNGTYTGAISGAGTLTQKGSGDITLSGTGSFSGATTISSGILTVNGSLASSAVAVHAGAELAGSGTVGAINVASGAWIAPGTDGSVGTLTVNGNAALSSGTTLLIDNAGGANDKLVVNGVLGAAGTVAVSNIGGYAPHYGDSSVIAFADSITGSFSALSDHLTGVLTPELEYVATTGGTDVVIDVTAASFLTQLANPTPDETTIALALDDARATHYNDLIGIYDVLDTETGATLAQSLESLAPDAERSLGLVGEMVTESFGDMVNDRLGDVGPGSSDNSQSSSGLETQSAHSNFRPSSFHIDGVGLQNVFSQMATNSARQQEPFVQIGENLVNGSSMGNALANLGNAADGSSSSAGDTWLSLPNGAGGFLTGRSLGGDVTIGGGGGTGRVTGYLIGGGLDFALGTNYTLGATIAFGHATTRLRQSPESSRENFVQGGVYGRYDGDDNLFVTGFATLGGESIKTKRTVVLGPTTYNLTGKTNGTSPSFSLKVGKAYQVEPGPDALILTPSAEIRYEQANVDSYMEHGGVPAMAFGDYDNGVPTAHLGIDAKKTVGLGDLMLTPSANVGIVEVMGGRVSTIQAAFVGAPTSLMSFDDTPHSSSYGEYGLGLDADLGKTLGSSSALSMRYDSDFGRRDMSYHSWTVSLKFNL